MPLKTRLESILRHMWDWFHSTQACIRVIANQWWRPFTAWSIGLTIFISGVYLPIDKGTPVEFGALAALVASLTPFIAARTIEKIKSGVDENE